MGILSEFQNECNYIYGLTKSAACFSLYCAQFKKGDCFWLTGIERGLSSVWFSITSLYAKQRRQITTIYLSRWPVIRSNLAM